MFAGSNSSDACSVCSAGYVKSSTSESLLCQPCPVGFYEDAANASNGSCVACQVGTTTSRNASTSAQACTVCLPGYAGTPCSQCEAGKYSPGGSRLGAAAACATCPTGSTTMSAGSNSSGACSVCLEGYAGVRCTACPEDLPISPGGPASADLVCSGLPIKTAVCAPLGTCKVAVLHWGNDGQTNDIKASLVSTSAFAKVDSLDVSGGPPSKEQLQEYDAVLAYVGFENPLAMPAWTDGLQTRGDKLADYFNEGGNVVVAALANTNTGILGGNWHYGGYDLIATNRHRIQEVEDSAIQILESDSPLVKDVTSFTSSAGFKSQGAVVTGATIVANWGSGAPLIVRGVKKGRKLVSLNFYPVSSRVGPSLWDSTTDGAAMMRNALLYY